MFLINIRLNKMYNKAISENGGTLGSVSNQYRIQKICNEAVNSYVYVL